MDIFEVKKGKTLPHTSIDLPDKFGTCDVFCTSDIFDMWAEQLVL